MEPRKDFTAATSRRLGNATFPLLRKKPQQSQQVQHTSEGMLRLWRMLRLLTEPQKPTAGRDSTFSHPSLLIPHIAGDGSAPSSALVATHLLLFEAVLFEF